MSHKKVTAALLTIISIGILSCQKEIKNPDNIQLQQVNKPARLMEGLKATAMKYKTSTEQSYKTLSANLQMVKQRIKEQSISRNAAQKNVPGLLKANPNKKPVIHIPGDYPTLQAAIDNSQNGGKIIIHGSIFQSGDVIADVPNLTIQGAGENDQSFGITDNSVTGDNLIITAPGVTVKNLKLKNLGIMINNGNDEKLMNLSGTHSNPGIFSFITLLGSINTLVKNCNISYSVLGGNDAIGVGIFLDDFSNNNEVDNCKVSNTAVTAFEMEGSNNRINNCEAVNFARGFSAFAGVSTGNVYTGCVANHSYSDAGFVFLNFTPNNTTVTLKNCTANDNLAFASIIDFGGSVVISNCTANLNTRNFIANNFVAVGIFVGGIGQTGESANVSSCTTNLNATAGIGIFNINFLVTNNTSNKNSGLFATGAGAGSILLNRDDGQLPMSGMVKGNTTDFNANNSIGLSLFGITNSTIINNESLHNAVCDFNQTNCSGNTITNNNFGTSCTGL